MKLERESIHEWRNYRQHSSEALSALADDMRVNGYRAAFPVEVCPDPLGGFFLITGHGRHAAATLAGLEHVEAIIYPEIIAGSPTFLDMQLRENIAREQSNPLEEGRAFSDQIAAGRTLEEIARAIDHSVRYVQDRLDAASLDPIAQVLATTPGAGLRYCTALVGLPEGLQAQLAQSLLSDPRRMSLEAWREMVGKARGAWEETLHVGLFDLASQEWNAALGEYVTEAEQATAAAKSSDTPEMLTVEDMADRLGVTRAAILKRIQRGTLTPDFRFGNLPGWYATTELV